MTSINLDKGQRLDLSKEAPGATKFRVELGWTAPNDTFDLDSQAFQLDANGKLVAEPGFVFYNNLVSPDGSVTHRGDNLTGTGNGPNDPDEILDVDLAKAAANVDSIVFTITLHEAAQKGQNFGQCRPAWVRIIDDAANNEVAKYDLDEDASTATALIFARFYRRGPEWKFEAVGQAAGASLKDIVNQFALIPVA